MTETRSPNRITKRPFAGDFVPAVAGFADLACLASAPGAVGDCIRPKGHTGFHQGAFGWAWGPVACDGVLYLTGEPRPCRADAAYRVTTTSVHHAVTVENLCGLHHLFAVEFADADDDPFPYSILADTAIS